MDKFVAKAKTVLTIIGVILIAILVFPLIVKNKDILAKIQKILNPNLITGNTEFKESHESTKNEPKLDIKVDGEWKTVDIPKDLSKHPVTGVFVIKNRKDNKVEVEITHEVKDRKGTSDSSTVVSKSALDYLQSRK